MPRLKLVLALFALCSLLVSTTDAWGCSDPEQHKIHLRQEMEARLRNQTGSAGAPQTTAPTATSALDSADSFFKTPAAQSTQEQRTRRR
jgi:hypothetical protein